MHDTSAKNAGTRHAIALKPRENYCNLERLHNRNQPFLRVYRNFISLHLNYVVQWLCKSMLNCSPMIDYQLVKWYILFSDAKDKLYLRSISYAIRGTNAVQKTTKQAEQSIRPTT